MFREGLKTATLILALCALIAPSYGDTLLLADGTVLENCYVRDEGARFIVWESMDKVGSTDFRIIPRTRVANVHGNPKYDRGQEWNAKPQLPDLTVSYIEMEPRLASFHNIVQYDHLGAPTLGGSPALKDTGDRKFLHPEEIAKDLKIEYKPGETITLTAHVKNVGFVNSAPFEYRWLINDKEVAKGKYDKPVRELDEAEFEYKYIWQEGKHTVTFEIITTQKEIATINNRLTDALWGFGTHYIVNPKRSEAWHQVRSHYGTFSWEDYYRWHLEIMNVLFEASVYPSAPQGIITRMRLDKITYLDEVTDAAVRKAQAPEHGIHLWQAYWTWTDSPEQQAGDWSNHQITDGTEWSLPHELGHQLGLIDYYAIDYAGDDTHKWPDNGEKVYHLHFHPLTMMAWHGPHIFNEVDAMYLNSTWNKPRGYFGDYYFAIPDENFIKFIDMNGKGVVGSKVEIFQRTVEVDKKGSPKTDQGITWYPIIEDGDFYSKPLSEDPVIVGTTDAYGYIRLPNRDVREVKTFNGFHRKANPFGNINVVGGRGLMLVKVTKDGEVGYYWLEAADFVKNYARGFREKYVKTLQTPYGSPDSPVEPENVRWEYTDDTNRYVRVFWDAGEERPVHLYDRTIAFRVYRRTWDMGLNDRPWYSVATVNSEIRECVIDLEETLVHDIGYYTDTQRFGVTSVGATGVQSGIKQGVKTQN